MSAVTGEQYEITFGSARTVVTEIGAGLRAFAVGDTPYAETYGESEHPPLGCGAVLVPWPNRVAGAIWTFDGQPQHLAVTEEARGNAIHGLVRKNHWRVTHREGSTITLETDIPEQPGWPVALRTTITYALDQHGLTVTHGVTNTGDRAVPFGVGTHPYPRAGLSRRDDCTLQLAATTVLPTDPERMIPSAPPQPVEGTEYDFRTPKNLAGIALDTPFGGCEPDADGLVHHRLVGPEGGVELWADPVFRWVQSFTPDGFPGTDHAIAIEPMTCPPDALNSGTDLITLEPGQSWSGRWGLTPLT